MTRRRIPVFRPRAGMVLAVIAAVSGCSQGDVGSGPTSSSSTETAVTRSADATSSHDDGRHPDVIDAELEPSGDAWRVAATISSPYDTPDRYADAFRVMAPDGTVLGVRELLHDHAAEQPFTRSLDGVEIPPGVAQVTVQGRDLANGWGGDTVTVDVPR